MPDFSELVERLREDTNLEYKESQRWNALRAKIAKTALGMANLRDGGFIVIGVRQGAAGLEPAGVSEYDLSTFDEDKVRAYINSFAEPPIRVELHRFPHADGRIFVVIAVGKFAEVPIIAKKSGAGIRQGALYIRSARMPETREVQSESEMRAVLDLATQKGLAKFLGTLERVGIRPSRLASLTDTEMFERQREGL